MLSFFPRGVLDKILNLIELVFEGFPSYSYLMIISIKSHLYRALISEEIIFFFHFLHYGFHGNQYKRAVGEKYMADFSRNIFIKVLSKYLQLPGNKCRFSIFPL